MKELCDINWTVFSIDFSMLFSCTLGYSLFMARRCEISVLSLVQARFQMFHSYDICGINYLGSRKSKTTEALVR